MAKIDTLIIHKHQLEVHCNSEGYFTITNKNGDQIAGGRDLDQVRKQARTKLRDTKRRVAVMFLTEEGRPGIAKGKSQTGYDILVQIEDDSEKGYHTARYSNYQSVYSPDTPDHEFHKYIERQKRIDKLAGIQNEFRSKYRIHLGSAVDKALAELNNEND